MSETVSETLLTACPHCRRRYRVRADIVPPRGIRARCPHCGAMFPIVPAVGPGGEGESASPPVPVEQENGVEWSEALEQGRPETGVFGEVRPRPLDSNGVNGIPEPPEVLEKPVAEDPHAEARSMARALAGDLVAYHPSESLEGASQGRLVELLGGQIARSWEMYVEEVGAEFAASTTHFQDAMNELLAGGRKYF